VRLGRFQWVLLALPAAGAVLGTACGDAFTASEGAAGSDAIGGESTAGSSSSSGSGRGPEGGGGYDGGGGEPSGVQCTTQADCGPAPSACLTPACVEGVCAHTPAAEDTECDGGRCDGDGRCLASTCDSNQKDGDETGVDCGGSCALCDDGAGCSSGADCLSGVCKDALCQASECTDKVKNGAETGVDCGGACPLKCALGQGCAETADCAVASGERAESVRCVEAKCVSTKPPGESGAPHYWQDFAPERLVANADSCSATDKVCLVGATALYQMGGIGTNGAFRALTKELLLSPNGVVGGGGVFNGTVCLTRPGTDLSFPGVGALTAMAWVRSTRPSAPWEGAIVGGLGHYFIAVDANPATQRFLAAIGTSQSTSFDYKSSTATAELGAAQWHHVAATYDTAAAKLLQYVDGKLVNTTTLSGNIPATPVAMYLGCRKDAAVGQFFWGYLDELALYRRALSAAELSDYVRRTKP
jgi:hypothetical protein